MEINREAGFLRGDYMDDDILAVACSATTERQPVQWPIRPKAENNPENNPAHLRKIAARKQT